MAIATLLSIWILQFKVFRWRVVQIVCPVAVFDVEAGVDPGVADPTQESTHQTGAMIVVDSAAVIDSAGLAHAPESVAQLDADPPQPGSRVFMPRPQGRGKFRTTLSR